METGKSVAISGLYEFLGTAFFVSAVVMSPFNPWTMPLVLFMVFTLTQKVSGGHLNWAVTLAVFIGRKRFDKPVYLAVYLAAQLFGACLGCFLGKMAGYEMPFLGRVFYLNDGESKTGGYFSVWDMLWAEMWATYLFTLVFLCVTDKHTNNSKDAGFAGVAIALAWYCAQRLAVNSSGGCLSPATALNLETWQAVFKAYQEVLSVNPPWFIAWVYVLGPIWGALSAANFYAVTHHPYLSLCHVVEEVVEHIEQVHHGDIHVDTQVHHTGINHGHHDVVRTVHVEHPTTYTTHHQHHVHVDPVTTSHHVHNVHHDVHVDPIVHVDPVHVEHHVDVHHDHHDHHLGGLGADVLFESNVPRLGPHSSHIV